MARKRLPHPDPEEEARRESKRQADRAYAARHREENRLYAQAYRVTHKDEIRQKDKTYHAQHRERIHAQKRAYLATHREENKARCRRHYRQKRTAYLEASRLYRLAHAEEKRARDRAYYAANMPKILAYLRQYFSSPHGRMVARDNAARRRAREAQAPLNDFTHADFVGLCEAVGYRCCYCQRRFPLEELTRDHLTPYVKQGSNTLHNILPCCLRCNKRKGPRGVLRSVQPMLFLEDALKKK